MARLTNTSLCSSSQAILNSHAYAYNAQGWATKQTRADGSYADFSYDKSGDASNRRGWMGSTLHFEDRTCLADPRHAYRGDSIVRSRRAAHADWADGVSDVDGLYMGRAERSPTRLDFTCEGGSLRLFAGLSRDEFSLNPRNFTAIATDGLCRAYAARLRRRVGRSATNSGTVPPSVSQSFVYDASSNLPADGCHEFDCDLSSIARSATEDGLQRRRMGREFTWTGSAWQQTLLRQGYGGQANDLRYIYWGKLVLQECHFDPRISTLHPVCTVSYTRGLDLSGSIEGAGLPAIALATAGGIGGLLARSDHSPLTTSHSFYHNDAIGNVTALVNESQAVVARYLYDPFGNLIASSGPMADANLYRFSSKELHANSGLIYFGYRFYEPSLQRWMNRDPIGVRGGVNLHRFVGNSSLNRFDGFGYLDDPIFTLGPLQKAPPQEFGSGIWGAKRSERDMNDRQLWVSLLAASRIAYVIYPNAALHMLHYLLGSGRERSINIPKLIAEDRGARIAFANMVDESMHFAERVDPLTYGDAFGFSSAWRNVSSESQDWIHALGTYKTAISARVRRSGNSYTMILTYHLDDWYDWDDDGIKTFRVPQSVVGRLPGNLLARYSILTEDFPDPIMGRLHEVGLAREYHVKGRYEIRISWWLGQSFDRELLEPRWPEDRVK